VVLTSIFDWMVNRGYELHADWTLKSGLELIMFTSRIGLTPGLFPQAMPKPLLRKLTVLRQVSRRLEKALHDYDTHQRRRNRGFAANYVELLEQAEAIRKEDCIRYFAQKTWQNDQGWLFEPEEEPPTPLLHTLFYSPGISSAVGEEFCSL
jgi:hypothetical protein